MSNAGSITFLNDLSGWQLCSRYVAMRQERQSGTPGGANKKSCESEVSQALRRRGHRSPCTPNCIHLALGHSYSIRVILHLRWQVVSLYFTTVEINFKYQ